MTTVEMVSAAVQYAEILNYEAKAASYVAKEIGYFLMCIGFYIEHREGNSQSNPFHNCGHCWIEAGYAMLAAAAVMSISGLVCSGVQSILMNMSIS